MTLPWIDGHLDLAYLEVAGRDLLQPCDDPALACISLPDLARSPVRMAFGTIFTEPGCEGPWCYGDAAEAAFAGHRQLEIYERLESVGAVTILRDGAEIPPPERPLGLILLMEGADPIRGPEDVSWWRMRGLRLVGLTWSSGTRYAGGNASGEGMTAEGRDLVSALDASGIMHDASHLSDAAFDDLLACTDTRIVATHSNSRTVLRVDDQRNLRDDHAKEIIRRGGVIGLNLYAGFLSTDHEVSIDDCLRHIMHFCDLAGNARHVALGSDFDGGFTPEYLPRELNHPRKLTDLLHALASAGFDERDLAGFTHANWQRALAS
jgi:membrane dipeptidase